MSITVRDKIEIIRKLEFSLELVGSDFPADLPSSIISDLDSIIHHIDVATSGYLNLITCLICSSIDTEVDPRFHRKPGKGMPAPASENGWFSGRTVSEKIIYPWLELKGFRTAKSGWQTRTFERPNPYSLDYPENIAFIKTPFLSILDYAQKNPTRRELIVGYLFSRELVYLENNIRLREQTAKNNVGNEVLIIDIISGLERHFSTPNSSHLPVIAVYSVYQLLIDEVSSYNSLTLKPLESHNASDLRTGSVGDIELEDADGDIIEGVEVKHGVEIDLPILLRAKEKIFKSKLKRYYILTTHRNCAVVNADVTSIIRQVYLEHGSQIIVNGVIPTIKYYLRMCSNPTVFLNNYSRNISEQSSVTVEQLSVWNSIISEM